MKHLWIFLLPITTISVTTILYLLFYRWKKKELSRFKNQKDYPTKRILHKELRWVFTTILAHMGIGGLMDWANGTQSYLLIQEFTGNPVIQFIVSLILMIFLHDGYFYWSHRLLHTGWLYNRVHKYHHHFHNPTPLTTMAAHPAEGMLQLVHIPIILLFLPIPQPALVIFIGLILISSTFGHLGHELRPYSVFQNPIGKHLFTTTHHNQHHRDGSSNFGFYFDFWDRFMKTQSPKYYDPFIDE